MRYLNKIVFINSASIKYAEIELNGNVHLIGTQGVGKSTLLRAILFFYNANKTKLGIPREKKSFDDYYFEYQNSYIIYEVIKDNIPFCVLAYKVNGKVAFRFFNSGYKRALFVDENNRALENWDKIRTAFGKETHYTPLVSSYEDFRRIIYGDNKGLKLDFKKYALIESKQYQNIPRTIQNVFLNSNLEAKVIKDTIINSINEDEFTIDIDNYSTRHLRDFESQINDIKIWFIKNKKGQIIIRNQAEKVIERYRILNYLKRENKELAISLAHRMVFIEKQKPVLVSSFSIENNTLTSLFNKKDNLDKTQRTRVQKIISEIDYHKKELAKASEKQLEYSNKNIKDLISKISEKSTLIAEEKTLREEKYILNSAFGAISQKYEALKNQVENQKHEFQNSQNTLIIKIRSAFEDNKISLFESYKKVIHQIKEDNKHEKEKAFNDLAFIIDLENKIKSKKSELKHQTFFTAEIEKCKADKITVDKAVSKSKSIILNAKNETVTIRKEWDLETNEMSRLIDLSIEKKKEHQKTLTAKSTSIEDKIKQSESSLYGWLNTTLPNWQNTIGKVIDEDNVLFNTQLNPKLVKKESHSFFGVELNLNTLNNRVKTVNEYQQEIADYKVEIDEIQKKINQLNLKKDDDLKKLKTKFRKKLNELKEAIAQNEYTVSQNEEQLKRNAITYSEYTEKAKTEKAKITQDLEAQIDKITAQKQKAESQLENIKKGIKRKITLKENERNAEIANLNKEKLDKISAIDLAIENHKTTSNLRLKALNTEQISELDNKGADTKRLLIIDNKLTEIEKVLDYINTNERTVFEYEKDKRELFDKIPELKATKISLEKKQDAIIDEHKKEIDKLDKKYRIQKDTVELIKSKIDAFEADENKFIDFKKSETYASIQAYFNESITEIKETKTAILIISEIIDKHYKGIETFKELQQATNVFNGNFNENNIFHFKVRLNSDSDFLNFASGLKEFIDDDKINEFEKRVNDRFANIIRLIGRETTELNSKKGAIEKIIKKINDDFVSKNFVEAIKEMEMRTQESSNPVVKLLIKIQEFNDENSLELGESNLFTSSSSDSKNQKAVDLLKELLKAIEKYKKPDLTLSESFDLQFRIVENDNDSNWVEKLSNVGSEGTDVLVKAMINILLLNVFKDSASRKFKDFKLHCMMDEIGRLHPNNVRGILRFANERNILLINGSPTSQNATDYKYTYKLAKVQSKTDAKKYITKINKLVKVTPKVLN